MQMSKKLNMVTKKKKNIKRKYFQDIFTYFCQYYICKELNAIYLTL